MPAILPRLARAFPFALVATCLLAIGLPAFSAEPGRRISALDLATLRDIEGLSISPDGEWAVFQVRQAQPQANRYDTAWHVISTKGKSLRRLAAAGQPLLPARMGRVNGSVVAVAPTWSPDSGWIAYLRRDGERTQVWRSSRDGQHTEQLTRGAGDARAIAYSKDGKRLLIEVEPDRAQLDVALAQEGLQGFLYDKRFFPSYSVLPILPRDVRFGGGIGDEGTGAEQTSRRIRVYDFERATERPATAAEEQEFAVLTAGPKPRAREHFRGQAAASTTGALVWTEVLSPERQGGRAPLTVVAQPFGASAPIVCEGAACTTQLLEGLWWRNHEVLYLRREGAVLEDQALYAWKPGAAAPRRILRTDGLLFSHEWNCAIGGGKLICFYEEPAYPRRLVAADLDSGVIETLYDPNPNFAAFDLGRKPQRLQFRSPAGVENYGYLVLPPDYREGERLPLVVVTYRCSGFLRGGTGDEYPAFPFAAKRLAVLCFNVPEPDYEKLGRMSWNEYGNYSRGPGDPLRHRVQGGLETAIAHLDRMGVIDTARVGITGLSFGAEAASYAAFSRLRPAAIILSGAEIGSSSAFLYGPAGRSVLREWGLGSPTSERWDALSIARNAGKVQGALLLNVADREMLNAVESFTALEEAGRAVEMFVYPDEYHIKWQPAHRLAVYRRNIDWMKFWLRGAQDDAPGKADQFERWRALRERQCKLFEGADEPWYLSRCAVAHAPVKK